MENFKKTLLEILVRENIKELVITIIKCFFH